MTVHHDLRVSRYRGETEYPSDLTPGPNPLTHHHVLVRAPGLDPGNQSLELLLEGINDAGAPVADPGPGFSSVRAVAAGTLTSIGAVQARNAAPIRPLKAHRLSDDKASPYYNLYLSDPFVLLYESVKDTDLQALQRLQSGEPREVFHSTGRLRVSLDPAVRQAHNALAPFASKIDGDEIKLGTAREASTFNAHRIVGPNPAPVFAEAVRAPGTQGMVAAHNGEVVLSGLDLTLPSPRMPLAFERHYRGQDQFSGPFGPGWDNVYGQRIVDIGEGHVEGGKKVLLVYRGDAAYDTAAAAGDLLLHTGTGDVVHYRRAEDAEVQRVYAADPLLRQLGLTTWTGAIWFMPPPGVHDALVRFGPRGSFLRVTPDGTELRYSPSGRLERITDRFGENRHDLVYNERGELRQIVDRSLSTNERRIKIGYYRRSSSAPGFEPFLDQVDSSGVKWNKVRRLSDDQGRDIRYAYDSDGRLTGVEGVEITTMKPDSYSDPRKLTYGWDGDGIRSIEGFDLRGGAPMFSRGPATDGVFATGSGARGSVTSSGLSPSSNRASRLLGARSLFTTDDGTTTNYKWTRYGLPEEVEVSGSGAAERTKYAYADDVLLEHITYPEENETKLEYTPRQTDNLRARANVLKEWRLPGGRSGAPLHRTMRYDERYNLPSGAQADFAGRSIDITLEPLGRWARKIAYDGPSGGPRSEETFRLDSHGRLEGHTSPEGVESSWTYDPVHGLLRSATRGTNADALTTLYDYDCINGERVGRPCTVTLPSGDEEKLDYTEDGLLEDYRRAGVVHVETSYDSNGRETLVKTELGGGVATREIRYTYDQIGFLEKTTVTDLETEGTTTDATWSNARGLMNRVSATTLPGGSTIHYQAYDLRGRLKEVTFGGYVEQFQYDKNGNLEVHRQNDVTTTRSYDGHDRVVSVTDAGSGMVIEYGHGGSGSPAAGAELETITVRDANGPLASVTGAQFDALGRLRAWTADGVSSTMDFPATLTTTFKRTDPSGAELAGTFVQDTAGRARSENVLAGGQLVRSKTTSYDISARTIDTDVNDAGVVSNTKLTFEPTGYLSKIEQGGATALSFTNRLDGVPLAVTDGAGRTTRYPASVLGEPLGRESPLGATFERQLDGQRRVKAEGRAGALRRYSYSQSEERLEGIEEPDGTVWTVEHPDPRNRPQSYRFSGPQGSGSIEYAFDARGQPTSRTTSHGGYGETETYRRDGFDRLLEANSPTKAVVAWSYARALRRTMTLTPAGEAPLTVDVELWPNRSPKLTTYTDGSQTFDLRDPSGKLQIKEDLTTGPIAMITELPNVRRVTLGGTGTLTRTDEYDQKRRLKARRYENNGQLVAGFKYDSFDGADRELTREWLHLRRTDTFDYYEDGSLKRATIGNNSSTFLYEREYAYDHAKHALTSVTTTPAPGVAPPPFVELAGAIDMMGLPGSITIGGAPFTQSTDALGNVRSTVVEHGAVTLEYDAVSRLRKLTRVADQTTIEYDYRADDVLLSRKVTCGPTAPNCANAARVYVYDGLHLLEDWDASVTPRELRARYYYADDSDIPVAGDFSPQGARIRAYFVTDRVGSVVGLLDENGDWIEQVTELDPYGGRPLIISSQGTSTRSSVGNVLGFQSHFWDADAGLYLARARVFNPTVASFLQRDPNGYQDSVNLYAAFKNDPVNLRDPTGRTIFDWLCDQIDECAKFKEEYEQTAEETVDAELGDRTGDALIDSVANAFNMPVPDWARALFRNQGRKAVRGGREIAQELLLSYLETKLAALTFKSVIGAGTSIFSRRSLRASEALDAFRTGGLAPSNFMISTSNM